MLGRILESPLVFMAGCLVWIPISIWIILMVRWMVAGDFEPVTGTVSILIAMTLGFFTVNPPFPALSPILLITVVATIAMMPFVRSQMNKRELGQIDVDAVERSYEALNVKPDNVAAMIKIAQVLSDRGSVGLAAHLYEAALRPFPESVFVSERIQLNSWKRMTPRNRLAESAKCHRCDADNDGSSVYCIQCGAPYLLDHVKDRWTPSGLARKLVAVWILVVLLLVGIPVVANALPIPWNVIVIALVMTGGLLVAISAFRDKEPETAEI